MAVQATENPGQLRARLGQGPGVSRAPSCSVSCLRFPGWLCPSGTGPTKGTVSDFCHPWAGQPSMAGAGPSPVGDTSPEMGSWLSTWRDRCMRGKDHRKRKGWCQTQMEQGRWTVPAEEDGGREVRRDGGRSQASVASAPCSVPGSLSLQSLVQPRCPLVPGCHGG